MFGFGPGYAELLRPDDAREVREEKEAAKARMAAAAADKECRNAACGRDALDGGRCRGAEGEDESESEDGGAFIRHVRFASGHRPLQRSCTIDTEADALAHGIDRQLFVEWTRYVAAVSQPELGRQESLNVTCCSSVFFASNMPTWFSFEGL